jgi:hypothetical protein
LNLGRWNRRSEWNYTFYNSSYTNGSFIEICEANYACAEKILYTRDNHSAVVDPTDPNYAISKFGHSPLIRHQIWSTWHKKSQTARQVNGLCLSQFNLILILIKEFEFDKMIVCISPKCDPLFVFSFPFCKLWP